MLIDNYLLEELVTFAECKTLSKTAAALNVTQPSITRGLSKLESDLGVKLFERDKNQLRLTKTGELAVSEAKQLLESNHRFVTSIQAYAKQQETPVICTTAPGPFYILDKIDLQAEQLPEDQVETTLLEHKAGIVLTSQEIFTDAIESLYLGSERLFVNINKFHSLASKKSVSFKELAGLSFVVLDKIGIWSKIIQTEIPEAKFLYQANETAFQEIIENSAFPYFSTNFTVDAGVRAFNDDRVLIPIKDESATLDFYSAYLKTQKKQMTPYIKEIIREWPSVS